MSSTMAMLTLMLFFTVFFFGESKKSSDFVGLTLDTEKPIDPGQCGKFNHGEMKLVQDRLGADRVLICTDKNSMFLWKTIDGSSTIGEYFDPALDCSDVVDRVPAATDGFYWINSKALPNVSKIAN
ncbi:Hypothetical predicted protein [Paramuricea clavata]|uniref:Uncharacterized protein n=1 Tax=Paramuricea clavata TaxID=317549 RepID=A0A7D9DCA5_PARCT|nr:Hypothetical predicted protein [Paramuricea clavata]